ncbi:PQQ-dependent sugar dehydrogenase [Psychroflexus sediminis]|uniref:Glucose/arabinose dehydrogenase, beta-propeller fold n=1 Tax=Psychroflexus sediminis TaxID=470826 RepID=A0A1G7VES6_9FLAO|nr:PQQ-dependent sugar dehydrogenase [Psychroflexus sediminis]SDG58081.1 Glucose/arabinose dehydrogenase, beta-propeller fold [Psychroflexus sediminis]
MKIKAITLFVCCAGFLACAQEDTGIQSLENDYEHEVIIDAIDIAWGLDFFKDGSFLATSKEGQVYYHKNGETTKVAEIPNVYNRGQGGLLDLKIHPEYPEKPWVYMSHASTLGEEEGGHTALVRAPFTDGKMGEIELLYKASPNTTKGVHFGSRLQFDREGYLYMSIGERGAREVNPQDITRDGGKIYRFNDDGSIPEDNPFYILENAKKAIYSYGHRNPQGMDMHPETGEIWVHEHGPRGGDEINIIKKAANYGWPIVSYGINYDGTEFTDETSMPGLREPFHYWVPSIAPSGMSFVTSDKYPELKGDLLVGSLKFQYLEHLDLEENTVQKRVKLLDKIGRVRSVKQSPDGFIYVGVEGVGIIKMLPKS